MSSSYDLLAEILSSKSSTARMLLLPVGSCLNICCGSCCYSSCWPKVPYFKSCKPGCSLSVYGAESIESFMIIYCSVSPFLSSFKRSVTDFMPEAKPNEPFLSSHIAEAENLWSSYFLNFGEWHWDSSSILLISDSTVVKASVSSSVYFSIASRFWVAFPNDSERPTPLNLVNNSILVLFNISNSRCFLCGICWVWFAVRMTECSVWLMIVE